MTTAGLYETSGDWLYDVGLPGKSGIGGGIVTVSPGKGGLGTFAPPLDAAGNSVRGQLATRFLARALGLDLLASSAAPSDPEPRDHAVTAGARRDPGPRGRRRGDPDPDRPRGDCSSPRRAERARRSTLLAGWIAGLCAVGADRAARRARRGCRRATDVGERRQARARPRAVGAGRPPMAEPTRRRGAWRAPGMGCGRRPALRREARAHGVRGLGAQPQDAAAGAPPPQRRSRVPPRASQRRSEPTPSSSRSARSG